MVRADDRRWLLVLLVATLAGCGPGDAERSGEGRDPGRAAEARVDLAAAAGSADPLALLDELAAQRPAASEPGRDPFSRHARPATRTHVPPDAGRRVEPQDTGPARPPRLIGISRLGGDAVAVFDSGSARVDQRVGRWTVRLIDGNRVALDDGTSVVTLEL